MSALPDPGPSPNRHVVVAALAGAGLAVTRDAAVAGFRVTGMGEPTGGRDLVTTAADGQADALHAALAAGRLRITDEPTAWAGVDVAVVADPGDRPIAEFVEAVAVDLAPNLTPDALVILVARAPVRQHAEILTATVELLTGLRAGGDYQIGFAVCGPSPSARPVIATGLDDAAADRTARFCRYLGYDTVEVTPLEAAETVALLAHRPDATVPVDPPPGGSERGRTEPDRSTGDRPSGTGHGYPHPR